MFAPLLALICALALAACDSGPNTEYDLDERLSESQLPQEPEQERQQVLLFGFDRRASPLEDARQYLPFLSYLEKTTGYGFKLRFMAKDDNIVDALGKNRVQFASIGAESFLRAQARYGAVPLVRGVNHLGKAEYQSVFVVRPDSPIRRIEDIRGRRMAFGSVTSTQGHLIPRIVLTEHDIGMDELASYDFTGSHYNCADAVVSGAFDVCGMQDTMARSMAEQGLVRIIFTSDYYPSSGIAANKDVPKVVLEKVKQALLDFQPQGKDGAELYNWEKTEMPLGFVAASKDDYTELKHWSMRLGFLKGDDLADIQQ